MQTQKKELSFKGENIETKNCSGALRLLIEGYFYSLRGNKVLLAIERCLYQ